jgi:hypothetical protein
MWWDLAVSVDGSYVFFCFERTMRVYRTCDGALERTLGDNEVHLNPGTFFLLSNVAVAPDDYVFVFDGCGVEVFSPMPHLRLHTASKYPHPHPSYVYADVSRLYIKCYADSEIMVLSSDTGAVLRQRNLSAELANVMEMNGEMAGVRADGTLSLLVSGFSYRQVLNLRNSPGQGTGRSWAVSRRESKFKTTVN